jgi:hypothetical protein
MARAASKEQGMARARTQPTAAVGVTEHGNSAVLVTVGPGGELLDRRRIDLRLAAAAALAAVGRQGRIPGRA